MNSHLQAVVFPLLRLIVVLGLCAGALSLRAEPSDAPAEWVQQLGDDSFRVRENAEKQLVAEGPSVRPLLEALKDSPDPEIRMRVLRILENMGSDIRQLFVDKKEFSGQASEGQKVWPCTLKIQSFDEETGVFKGSVEWTTLNALHEIEGTLTKDALEFRETKYIRRGNAMLGVVYTFARKGADSKKLIGEWKSADASRNGTAEIVLQPKAEEVPVEMPINQRRVRMRMPIGPQILVE